MKLIFSAISVTFLFTILLFSTTLPNYSVGSTSNRGDDPTVDKRPPKGGGHCCSRYLGEISCVNEPLSTRVNLTTGVNIKYPLNWSINKTIDSNNYPSFVLFPNLFTDLEDFGPNCENVMNVSGYMPYLQILIENPDVTNFTTQDALSDTIKFFKTKIAMDNITTSNSLIDNHPAYKLEYDSIENNTIPTKVMEIGLVIGNKIYYFDYFAGQEEYDKALPDINRILESIQIDTNKET